MSKEQTVIKAFISSPSDVADERNVLEDVIRELNQTWSEMLGIRIEPLLWETHAYPDVDLEPQAVINRQIGNDFDIFLGIMWSRFGTPTKKYSSGTEEEFNTAYKIFETKERRVWIMIYFKDAGIPPSQIDTDQLKLINDFKVKLGDEGVLRWKFRSKDEFAQLTRLHLSRVVQEWIKEFGNKNKIKYETKTQSLIAKNESDSLAEFGYLDYAEKSQENGQKATEVMNRITSYLVDLTQKTNSRTEELKKANLAPNKNQILQILRRNTNSAAEDLEEFSKRLDLELPFFKSHTESAIGSFTKLAELESQFSQQPKESINNAANSANMLLIAFKTGRELTAKFRQVLANTPNMSGRLNAAKHQALSVLDRYLANQDSAIRLTIEAESVLRSLILR
jgi:Domain of unknown function (DUF4062)